MKIAKELKVEKMRKVTLTVKILTEMQSCGGRNTYYKEVDESFLLNRYKIY